MKNSMPTNLISQIKWTNSLKDKNLTKLTQKIADNLNRPISNKVVASISNHLPKQKVPGPYGFTGELCQIFNEEIVPILYNLFQKVEAEGILPNLYFVVLMSQPDYDFTRKNITNISHEQ